MKFLPVCRSKKLGKINTILGRVCSFLNWEGGDVQPQIRPWKIPDMSITAEEDIKPHLNQINKPHLSIMQVVSSEEEL